MVTAFRGLGGEQPMEDDGGNVNNKGRKKGTGNLRDQVEDGGQPLNPRIVRGLNSLYDGIVNDPLPEKITNILDQLREKERELKKSSTSNSTDKGPDLDD